METIKALQDMNKVEAAHKSIAKTFDEMKLTRAETLSVMVFMISQIIHIHSDWTVEYTMTQLAIDVERAVNSARSGQAKLLAA